MNCWEVKQCGEKERCAAFHAKSLDGFLGGINGGRACFFIIGTRCNGKLQETMEEKELTCNPCNFFHRLKREHGELVSNEVIRTYLRSKFMNTFLK